MKCLFCGADQPMEVPEACGNCGFFMGTGIETAYKNQLARIAEYVMAGEIPMETFSQALSHMSSVLDEMYKDTIEWEEYIPEGALPDQVRDVVMKPVRAMKDGIDAFGEAIQILNLYVVDPDEEHIVKGLKAANKAHNMMVNSTDLAGFALREVKNQMPEGTAPSDEELLDMIASSPELE